LAPETPISSDQFDISRSVGSDQWEKNPINDLFYVLRRQRLLEYQELIAHEVERQRSQSIGYSSYLIVDGLESTANIGGPSNRRIRTRAPRLQSNGEAGNDRYHKLVAPLTMARQPANLVRMPFSTPATLAQACRKLTILRTHRVVSSCAISVVAFAFDPKPKAILPLGVINQRQRRKFYRGLSRRPTIDLMRVPSKWKERKQPSAGTLVISTST
jgi:hypothetical protein